MPNLSGIEPDYCFYINNLENITDLDRIDWTVSPPPDLAIEVDVTSYTDINDYVPYRIPEVWIQTRNGLFVYLFDEGVYERGTSQIFPDRDIISLSDRFDNSSDAIASLLNE